LLIALFIEVFVRKKLNKFRIVVLLLAIITSFSTKAFLIVGIMIALKIVESAFIKKEGGENAYIIQFIAPVLFIILAFILLSILGQKSDSSSYTDRMDNLYTTMLVFKNHWLTGVGLGNEDAISQYSLLSLRWQGFSMGVTLLLAEGGIYVTGIYLASLFKALLVSSDKWLVICAGIVYFAILFTSNIPFFPSTIFILALGYASHRKQYVEEDFVA